jgi:hypothetical protein
VQSEQCPDEADTRAQESTFTADGSKGGIYAMTRREHLTENYEDALFALLMDRAAEHTGKKLLEENERFKQDESFALPEDVDQRCQKTIRREFTKVRCRSAQHTAYHVFSKAAVVVTIILLLFATAYAAVPAVRLNTLNLIITQSETATTFSFRDRTDADSESETSFSSDSLRGYHLPDIPDGFSIVQNEDNSVTSLLRYTNDDGAGIEFYVFSMSEAMTYSIDTEDAERVEEIQIHGCDGLFIEKQGSIKIVWMDSEHSNIVTVICTQVEEATVWELANEMYYEE